MLELDHVVIAASGLSAARALIEERLQVSMEEGGQHPIFNTHNAVLGVDEGVYVEAIAADPGAEAPMRPRWYDLDRFEGAPRPTCWACRTTDLEAMVAQFPEAGEIVSLSRGDFHWRMAVPRSGILPFDNLFPALLQWDGPEMPQKRLNQTGQLKTLTVRHPWAAALEAMLSPVLSDARVRFEGGPPGLECAFDLSGQARTL